MENTKPNKSPGGHPFRSNLGQLDPPGAGAQIPCYCCARGCGGVMLVTQDWRMPICGSCAVRHNLGKADGKTSKSEAYRYDTVLEPSDG